MRNRIFSVPRSAGTWVLAVVAGGLAVLGLRVHLLGDLFLTLDDAFISFRYARHLVEGHGLVYNLGERVEGYTNFLWTLLVAGGLALGFEPVRFTEILNFATVGATLALLFVAGRRLFGSIGWAFVPPLVYALGDRARFVESGMEMLFFALLVFAGAWVVGVPRGEDEPASRARLAAGGVLFALAGTTHPEGLLYGALTGLWLVARRTREAGWRVAAGDGAALLSGCLTIVVPWTAWRLAYYGDLLPNTAHAKLGANLLERFFAAYPQLFGLLRYASYAPWLALAVVGVLLGGGLGRSRRREPFLGLAALLAAAVLVYFVWAGGDYVPFFGARFLLPALPFLLLLGIEGLRRLAALLAPPLRGWVVGAVTVLAVADSAWWLWPVHLFALDQLDTQHRAWRHCADWLAENSTPDTLIATGGAGIIPFYAERTTIDMYGLTDHHIARVVPDPFEAVAHQKYDGAYVLDRAPELILAYGVTPTGIPTTGGLRWQFRRVRREYEVIAQVKVRQGSPAKERWIVPTDGFDSRLYRQGWAMAILRRRPEPSRQEPGPEPGRLEPLGHRAGSENE